ncbi:uncharacterized protein JCM10292_005969 [Rhodotorula paludigena]|uniref:uncharacterized protein n=1 Tax=Rhodotorula paludigena TaxID=86838 RepID=UPI00317EBD81
MRFTLALAALAILASLGGADAKKHKAPAPRTLCPAKEIACPILGSTTYGDALAHHFSSENKGVTGVMAGSGGYECIDTNEALDSCGGCASTGEGQDCTKIRGSAGVGCSEGRCVVFSCQPGWKPSLSGSKCIRARAAEDRTPTANNDSRAGARRHLAGRHARPLSH